jgi:hypothetical protein
MHLRFSITVTVEYSNYDFKTVIDEGSLIMRRWNGSAWGEAPLTCDPPSLYIYDYENNLITLSICQAGLYALFGSTYNILLPSVFNGP